jgi:hypothetical protein
MNQYFYIGSNATGVRKILALRKIMNSSVYIDDTTMNLISHLKFDVKKSIEKQMPSDW